MSAEFEVWMARRIVATRRAPNAREAAIDYVRSLGCPANEITYLAGDAVSWRGAVYRGAPVSAAPPATQAA